MTSLCCNSEKDELEERDSVQLQLGKAHILKSFHLNLVTKKQSFGF